MASPQPPITLHGDEAAIFAAHHDRLLRALRRRVIAPDALIEDAVSITWLKFMRRQPERSAVLFGWLLTVAEREAWRLCARSQRTLAIDDLVCGEIPSVAGPEDAVEARCRIELAAGAMTQRQCRIVGLQAAGFRYDEIAELTGDTIRTVERQILRGRRGARAAA